MALLTLVAARPGPRGVVSHTEEAVHAVIRCGRGEGPAAEPGRGALVLAFCLRVGVGVRAARAVFFVTLGTVSSSDLEFPSSLGRTASASSLWLASSQSTQHYRRFSCASS